MGEDYEILDVLLEDVHAPQLDGGVQFDVRLGLVQQDVLLLVPVYEDDRVFLLDDVHHLQNDVHLLLNLILPPERVEFVPPGDALQRIFAEESLGEDPELVDSEDLALVALLDRVCFYLFVLHRGVVLAGALEDQPV